MPAVQPCAAIILAAGASSRMGFPKPLLTIAGQTFIDRLIETFGACCEPVIAVLGHHSAEIRAGMVRASEALIAINPSPESGMLSSLQAGLRSVPPCCRSVFFHPCDMPGIGLATLQLLIGELEASPPGILAAVPTLNGKRGHPVLMRSSWIPSFLALDPAASARGLLESALESVLEVPVADPAARLDFDTREEFERVFGAGR